MIATWEQEAALAVEGGVVPYKQPKLTIIEGKWFPNRHLSILQLFHPLFSIWTPGNDGAFHYEMFTTRDSLAQALRRAFEKGRASTVYVAAHGSSEGIHGFDDREDHDRPISRTVIANALKKSEALISRRGIFFGACEFGGRQNAEFLMKNRRVQWVAGYEKNVGWIDSTLLDIFFLQSLLFPFPGSGRHKTPRTPGQRLRFAARKVRKEMPGLAAQLKFHVWTRKKKTGKLEDLASSV